MESESEVQKIERGKVERLTVRELVIGSIGEVIERDWLGLKGD